jgi:hypothetical protein
MDVMLGSRRGLRGRSLDRSSGVSKENDWYNIRIPAANNNPEKDASKAVP